MAINAQAVAATLPSDYWRNIVNSVIQARQVGKTTGKKPVSKNILSDINLEIGRGEFLCVMGPSGSGKTTLLHILAGLDEPSTGEVIVGDKSLSQASSAEVTALRRDVIGQVFQFFNLMPNLTLRENVALPLAIAGKSSQDHDHRIDTLLRNLGLTDRINALPHELSGGEMQRASIARALCGEQPLLLCDEPTGNLSQQAGLEVMQILQKLSRDDNKSILLVTHNPRDAAFADRVVFLVDGKLASEAELKGPDLKVEDIHKSLASLNI
ncbi:MAG: putative ABC transport system ATP-binding protein [Planctomycetota bacterium]